MKCENKTKLFYFYIRMKKKKKEEISVFQCLLAYGTDVCLQTARNEQSLLLGCSQNNLDFRINYSWIN